MCLFVYFIGAFALPVYVNDENNELHLRDIDASELHHIESLKDGGFGKVEKGMFREWQVVLKTPLSSEDYILKTFTEEAAVLSNIHHQNIVSLVGVVHETHTIVLEYINSGDVHTLIKRYYHLLTLRDKLDLLIQCAVGMLYLHTSVPVIVHRDLKTLNLLLSIVDRKEDELEDDIFNETTFNYRKRVYKVCDFGLARNQRNGASGISTQHKDMGTPCYQSPEQVKQHTTLNQMQTRAAEFTLINRTILTWLLSICCIVCCSGVMMMIVSD